MKNLYAVYIAINEYVDPVTPLKGCVRDAESLCEYIQERYEGEFQQHIKKITNSEATKANVITAFEHFEAAKEGDVCLFFFAGHGSQMNAPALFEHMEADGKLETLVCYDSRNGSGDLVDKELSYLIWKATKDKDIHFVTIMDCCHSGSNTRNIEENPEVIGERQTRDAAPPIILQNFLGFKHYQQKQKDKWTPPSGKHIALSACLSSQTAKEAYVGGQPTGAFTYFLVQSLKDTGGNLDYSSLVSKINTKVGLFMKEQSPQLQSDVADKSLKFLSQEVWDGKKTYLIKYDKKLKKWVVNFGAIHGLKKGNGTAQTIFQLEEGQENVSVDEVFATRSTLVGVEETSRKKVLEARLLRLGINRLKIGVSDELAASQKETLKSAYDKANTWLFEFVEQERATNYLIRRTEMGFGLCTIGSGLPVFKSLKEWNPTQINLFLTRINSVCNWSNVLQLSHPISSIPTDAVELTFYRLTEVDYGQEDVPKEQVNWEQVIHLPYLKDNDPPSFQLKIKNTSNQSLWISTLYLQRNFAIHNNLLAKIELAPQEEKWLEIVDEEFRTRNIQVEIEKEFLKQGITQITEHLKLLVSTQEFSTDDFAQDALPQEGSRKGDWDSNVSVYGDWRSYELALMIQHP